MSVTQKLFTFQGRLRRRDWWMFVILLVIAQWIVGAVATKLVGGPTAIAPGTVFAVSLPVQLVVELVFLWPTLAISVKRLHDRGHSGWWLLPVYVLAAAQLYFTMGSVATMSDGGVAVQEPIVSHPTTLGLVLSFVLLAACVWLLIELGILDGTRGPNRFGPSPKGIGGAA